MRPCFDGLKVVIRCGNLDASRAFYHQIVGLPILHQWEENTGRGMIVATGEAPASALLEVYEMSPTDRRFDVRFRERVESDKIDLQLRTSSIEEWVKHLSGRWSFDGPEALPYGQRWIRLRDPDGLLIAIYTGRD